MKSAFIICGLIMGTWLSVASLGALPKGGITQRPKLVVLIAIDQFRADYLTRFSSRFLAPRGAHGIGGYRYLMTNGAYFPAAQYTHLHNMTGPGHSTMLSGATPYQSGIPLNYWFDVKTGKEIYCAQDTAVALVPAAAAGVKSGTSPKNLIADTVGDGLKNAGYASRVVSLSLKDRSAIFMGGHRADLALWFEPQSFQWVSSRHYLPEGKLPEWVAKLNERVTTQKESHYSWEEKGTPTSIQLANKALANLTKALSPNFGAAFPHKVKGGNRDFLASPRGVEITWDAAKAAIEKLKLGTQSAPDLLAVSISSHDYLGHAFGPNSQEMEAMTVAEDQQLSQFLNFLEKRTPGGLKNVLFVLTADHGIPPNPLWLKENRLPAGIIEEEKLMEKMERALVDKFGKPDDGKWIAYTKEFQFYFDSKNVGASKYPTSTFAEQLKSQLQKEEWVAYAFTQSDVEKRTLPPGKLEKQILATYYPGRSGQVIVIPKPYYMPEGDTVTHVTGYNYDSTVPLIFAGPNVKAGTFGGGEIIDIAPTISFLLGLVPPALSEGKVLTEIF